MIDPKNVISITGGVVSDPELINDKIAKFRLAVDYAGSEKGSQNNSGYFDVVYYLKDKDGFVNKNASFVSAQVDQGKMKKGSTISVIGRLVQERWKQDGQSRSRVVIVVEHLTYAPIGKSSKSTSDTTSDSTSSEKASSIPSSF